MLFFVYDTVLYFTLQVEAAKYDLNYIGLTGNIGCMGKYGSTV